MNSDVSDVTFIISYFTKIREQRRKYINCSTHLNHCGKPKRSANMSLNTAHLNGGVLIHSGEQWDWWKIIYYDDNSFIVSRILLFADGVSLEWSGQQHSAFNGTKKGAMYLTTHRNIFLSKSSSDEMQSFSMPFVTLSEVSMIQIMISTGLKLLCQETSTIQLFRYVFDWYDCCLDPILVIFLIKFCMSLLPHHQLIKSNV